MSISLGERIFVPALIAAVFAMFSGGFMFVAKGATHRMRIIWECTLGFVIICLYAMAWHDKIDAGLGFRNAWKAVVALSAVGSFYMCRRFLARRSRESESDSD
jgi:hypothetical protein